MLKNHVLPYFGTSQLGSVTPTDIQGFVVHITEKSLASSPIRQNYLLIASLFSSALESDLICGLLANSRPPERQRTLPLNDRNHLWSKGFVRSGWPDLDRRPLDPQADSRGFADLRKCPETPSDRGFCYSTAFIVSRRFPFSPRTLRGLLSRTTIPHPARHAAHSQRIGTGLTEPSVPGSTRREPRSLAHLPVRPPSRGSLGHSLRRPHRPVAGSR